MTWAIPRYAVIPSNGRSCLQDCIAAIKDQVDQVYVVLNGLKLIDLIHQGDAPVGVHFLVDEDPKANISRWWNRGIKEAFRDAKVHGKTQWDVAVLNDDAIVPTGWFDRLSETMRTSKVPVVSMGNVSMPVLHSRPGPMNLHTRPQGFAWMTAGEAGIQADEGMAWWAGDDDIWAQATRRGGVMVIPGEVEHRHPNGQVIPDLQVQIAKDMQFFVDKWGHRPW